MTSILTTAQKNTMSHMMSTGFKHSSDVINKQAKKINICGTFYNQVNAKMINGRGDKIYIMPNGTIHDHC